MSAASAWNARDPTLFYAVSFVTWMPRETSEETQRRLTDLASALRAVGWIPPGQSFPILERSTTVTQRVWFATVPHARRADWTTYYFARAYPEMLGVYTGVQENGLHPIVTQDVPGNWIERAAAAWAEQFGPANDWARKFTLPGGAAAARGSTPTGPPVLGRVWIWTGEQEPPKDGWQRYATALYEDTGFTTFPWGVLGRATRRADGLPTLWLHADAEQLDHRDRFLYRNLSIAVMEYCKALQFRWTHYDRSQGPELTRLRRELEDLTPAYTAGGARRTVEASEERTRHLTRQLFTFSSQLLQVTEAAQGMSIGRDAIRRYLREHSTSVEGTSLDDEVDLKVRQANSDLEYFRSMQTRASLAFEAQRTLGILNLARIGHFIAIATIGVSVFLGAEPILADIVHAEPPASPSTEQILLRLVLSLLLGLAASAGAYWWFFGRGRTDGRSA